MTTTISATNAPAWLNLDTVLASRPDLPEQVREVTERLEGLEPEVLAVTEAMRGVYDYVNALTDLPDDVFREVTRVTGLDELSSVGQRIARTLQVATDAGYTGD